MRGRLILGVLGLWSTLPASAQQTPLQIKSFSVGPDQTPSYPKSTVPTLPDEHTSFLPPMSSTGPYLVFGASDSGAGTLWGAIVLETTDFVNFTLPPGYSSPVLTSPLLFGKCVAAADTTFDENYAAPGSVLQDPTLPPGNLIMLYEAENHCPGGVTQFPFYATTGFARSSDNGKTWPAPVIGELGGPSRHPILQPSDPQPTDAHGYIGDAIPSGFVDKTATGDYYLYVSYTHYFVGTPGASPQIGVARARLGTDPLNFQKWYNGAFSQPGIGGLESSAFPAACGGRSQFHSEISYNDDLGEYLMIFVCQDGLAGAGTSAWYYSTATSLDLQNWTAPQMILNTQFPVTVCPNGNGDSFDGHYPSSVSPGAAAGHTKLTGYFFFMSGCGDPGNRQFTSRTFTIVAGPPLPEISLVANAEGEAPTIAPNTWVEIKGSNLAPAGFSSANCAPGYCWQGTDFVNNKMPTQLDRVSATMNGKSAFVYFISPTQLNILTPPDALSGTVQVQVTSNGVPSASFSVQAQSLSPSFFVFNGGPYVAATHLNGSYLGPTTLYPGLTTPAKPNEIVVLYANGFGTTSTPVVSGSVMQSGTLSPLPVVKIGGITASVQFAGLVAPGEFQFNVAVPANTPDGDQTITATYNGLATQLGTLITIQH